MKHFIVASFCIVALFFATPSLAVSNNYSKIIELATEAEDTANYQAAVDLLVPQIKKVPKDSVDILVEIYCHLSTDYFRLGDIDQAIAYGKRCLEIDEQSGEEEYISISLNNLAGFCLGAKRYELAEEYLKRGIEIEERLKRDDKLAVRLGMLSEVYTQQKRLDEAIALARRALELDRNGNRNEKVAIRLAQLGNVLVLSKKWKEAESSLDEAYKLLTKYENLSSLCITCLSLGQAKRGLGKRAEAEKYLKQTVELSEKIGQRIQRRDAFLELSKFYGEAKDYEHACHYLNAYTQLSDSLKNEDVQRQISDLQVKYETGQKELELAKQKVLIQRQQLVTIGVCILLVLLIIALGGVLNSLRLKKRMLRLRDELMRIISHDLKNPALASQRSLQMLNQHFDSLSASETHDEILRLSQSADAQVGLLYDLLTWAQLQTHRLDFNPIRMDLNDVVRKVVAQHSNQAKIKNITIAEQTAAPCLVYADKQMVSTILRNLLSNAIKFTPEGGDIEVSTNDAMLIVNDHGVGMDESMASTLGTNGEQGTGVGLGLIRTLVKKNNASIDIKSILNKGTRVCVTFPKCSNE